MCKVLTYNFGYDLMYLLKQTRCAVSEEQLPNSRMNLASCCAFSERNRYTLRSSCLTACNYLDEDRHTPACRLWSGQGALNRWTDTAANVVFSTLEVARASAVVFPASLRLNHGQQNRSSLAVGP